MIKGLNHFVFHTPVQAGEIVEVLDGGTRIFVGARGAHVELTLSRGLASLSRPKVGDYVVEYPHGYIDILSPEDFAAKVVAGGAGVR